MRISRLQLHNGEKIPRWYGIAYWDFVLRQGVAYPIPLNLLVAIALKIWWWVKAEAWDRQLHAVYSAGHDRGYRLGRTALWEHSLIAYLKQEHSDEAEYFKKQLRQIDERGELVP